MLSTPIHSPNKREYPAPPKRPSSLNKIAVPNFFLEKLGHMGCRTAQAIFAIVSGFNHYKEPSKYEYAIPYNRLTCSTSVAVMGKNLSKTRKRLQKTFENEFWKQIIAPGSFRTKREKKADGSIVYYLVFRLLPEAKHQFIVMTSKKVNIEKGVRGYTTVDERRFVVAKDKSAFYCYSSMPIANLNMTLRRHQWVPKNENTVTIPVENLKKLTGCQNYCWADFNRHVLKPGQQEMAEDWTPFNYTVVRSGKGGKVTAVTFTVKTDYAMRAQLGLNEHQQWEPIALKFFNSAPGFAGKRATDIVKNIKDLIAVGARVRPDSDYCWNPDYVLNSMKVGKQRHRDGEQGKVGQTGKKLSKIENLVAHTYTGMMGGWWIDQCEQLRRMQERKDIQRRLDDADALLSLQNDMLRKSEHLQDDKDKQRRKENPPPVAKPQAGQEPPPDTPAVPKPISEVKLPPEPVEQPTPTNQEQPEPVAVIPAAPPPEPPPEPTAEEQRQKLKAAEEEEIRQLQAEYDLKQSRTAGGKLPYTFEEFLAQRKRKLRK